MSSFGLASSLPSRTLILLATTVLLASLVQAQSLPITSSSGFQPYAGMGTATALGDINNDGCDDYDVTLSQQFFNSEFYYRAFHSGADHSAIDVFNNWDIISFSGTTPPPVFVPSYRPLGDIDGDGDAEFAQLTGPTSTTSSSVRIFETYGQPAVMTLTWPNVFVSILSTKLMGDLDNDGVQDIGVGGVRLSPGGGSYFEIRSGASGASLYLSPTPQIPLSDYAPLGDINDDGTDDFIISSAPHSSPASGGGCASLISGATSNYIAHFFGSAPGQGLGTNVFPLADLDGDGARDVLIYSDGRQLSPIPTNPVQELTAYSSVTRQALWTIPLPVFTQFFEITAIGDLNGDGHEDILVRPFSSALRQVRSGFDGSLITELSLSYLTILPPSYLATDAEVIVGDTTGDGISEIMFIDVEGPTLPTFGVPGDPGTTQFITRQTRGSLPYGNSTAGSTLNLEWDANPDVPNFGNIQLSGALPNANLLFGVSLLPWDGSTFGANHPLWISPISTDLLFTTMVNADGSGNFRSFDTLARPVIAGTVLYVQGFQTTLPDAASNGLELLYGN